MPARKFKLLVAACTVAALLAAATLAYVLRSRPASDGPVPPPAPIDKPCAPEPPCDPSLEMPCRAPTVAPCPAA